MDEWVCLLCCFVMAYKIDLALAPTMPINSIRVHKLNYSDRLFMIIKSFFKKLCIVKCQWELIQMCI